LERFHLKKLNDVEIKEQHQVKIWNMFAPLKNFDDDDVNINRAWDNVSI
jgi:hypothetical protein